MRRRDEGRRLTAIGSAFRPPQTMGGIVDPELFAPRPKQGLVLLLYGGIAFAGALAERVRVENLDSAPRVFYHASPLEGVGDGRHAGPADAEHLGEKFLRKG